MPIQCSVGGPWEVLASYAENNASGFTRELSFDGSKFLAIKFELCFAGQAINLNINSTARMWGAINRTKHDGSANYLHPDNINNSRYALLAKGTGGLKGWAIPSRQGDAGWLMVLNGFSAYDSAGGWVAAGGDYWRIDGRVYIKNNASGVTTWGQRFGFSSNEGGSYSLIWEGLRG